MAIRNVVLCGSLSFCLAGCSSPRPDPLVSSDHKATARATAVLRIEEQVAAAVLASGEWEMAQFRSYKQQDIDGDGIDDAILLTTFENGNVWHRELFVCLSSPSRPVMQLGMGKKGERMAENFEIKDRTIVVRGKRYADADAECCPSIAYQSVLVLTDGKIVERR